MSQKSKNLLEFNEPLIFNLENNIFGVVTDLYLKWPDNESKINININAHLYSEHNIIFTKEEEKKYLDILNKKVQNFIINDFINYINDSELTDERN